MNLNDVKIGTKLNGLCVGLVVIPLLLIGGFSLRALTRLGAEVSEMATERLTADGERQLITGAQRVRDETEGFVRTIVSDAEKLAASGTLHSYLEARDGASELWNQFTRNHAETVLAGILETATVQNEGTQHTLHASLALADLLMQGLGHFNQTDKTIQWNAINQFTRSTQSIDLPEIRLGQTVVTQNADPEQPSALVDEIVARAGGAATLFQRMNEQGDMLRVATSVIGNDGKRAIGTYIPATMADGTPNAVVAAVLRGETFVGRAFVVNAWYLTAYQPIRDTKGDVTGILFVGLNENKLNAAFADSIVSTKLGATGYPFVMNSKGDLLVHPRADLIGKNVISDLKIMEFQEVLDNRQAGEFGWITYLFEDREKFISYGYFPQWDWIICPSGYLDEMSVQAARNAMNMLRTELQVFGRTATVQTPNGEKQAYQQVRLLAPDGMEMIAVKDGALREDFKSEAEVEWFEAAKRVKEGGVYISPVTVSRTTGDSVIRVLAPVQLDKQRRGFIAIDADWHLVWEILSDNVFGQTGYAYVMNESGVLLSHPQYALRDNTNLTDSRYGALADLVRSRMLRGEEGVADYEFEGAHVYAAFTPLVLGDNRYVAATRVPVGEVLAIANEIAHRANERAGAVTRHILLASIVLALLGITIGLLFGKSLTVPLVAAVKTLAAVGTRNRTVADAVKIMAEGDFSHDIQLRDEGRQGAVNVERNDEIGRINRSVEEVRSQQNELIGSIQSMRMNINDILSSTRAAVEEVSSGSSQIADASQSLSQGATESAASLEQINASTCEIGSQAQQNAETATQANQLSVTAKAAAEKGSASMTHLNTSMAAITESSAQISKIIKTIDDIAFQTNILALNAAVEAARAGRHGKGFAVVAEEVRSLAARSAKAARETADLIEDSKGRVDEGNRVAEATAAELTEIVTSIVKVGDLVGEMAAASNEQARGIAEISQGLGQIDQVTQQNTATSEETAATAEELSGQASHLLELIARFKLSGAGAPPPRLGAKTKTNAKAQPQRKAAPFKPANGSADGWAGMSKPAAKPAANEDIISLEDKDFGRY